MARPQVKVTLSMFDTRNPIYRPIRTNVPLSLFSPVSLDEYIPAGGTPLRDAVGQFIGHLGQLRTPKTVTVGLLLDESGSMSRCREEVVESVNQFVEGLRGVDAVDKDAAGTVICVIVTDGWENASNEVGPEELRKIVADSESNGYTMIFLGSAIDAWGQGRDIGLSGGSTGQMVSAVAAPGGTSAAFMSVTNDVSNYLTSNVQYKKSRSSSSMRSVTLEGDEVLSNINEGAK